MIVNKPAEWKAPDVPPPVKLCKQCRTPLIGRRKQTQIFCSQACASEAQRVKWMENNPKSPLAALQNNTVAEVNEMRVAIDLLLRGYVVYRAAFQGMPCDLVFSGAVEQWGLGTFVRVEVTSGNRSTSGALTHPKRNAAQFDVLAVVLGDGTIVYKPEL